MRQLGQMGETPVFSVLRLPGMRSEYSWLPPSGGATVTKPQQVGVSFAEHRQVVLERGGRSESLDIRPGDVFANGRERLRWTRVAEPDEVVEIYPDPALLRAAAGTDRGVEIEPLTAGRDAVVLAIASTLKQVHVHDVYCDEVKASALAHRLAEHLVTHYGGIRRGDRPPGRLDRVLLNRVAEVVESRLGEALTINDLAAAATLSPFHFARSFKASTGMAPHEFVTARRMNRAKALLLRGRLSVPEVAYSVGYMNLSHFRRVFRRYTGFLPSELRIAPRPRAEHSKNRPSQPAGGMRG